MRSAYLAEKIRKAAPELSAARALVVARELVAGIRSDLKTGGRVCLRGVGTLKVSHRTARERRNPRTGDLVVIPAGNFVRFRMSPALKDVINGGAARGGEGGE